MTHLQMEHVVSGYASPVLQHVNFSIEYGSCVGIIGPNGAGKSTLIKTITRVLPLQEGQIYIDGHQVSTFSAKELARKVAVVNQSFSVGFNYRVEDIVRLGRFAHADRSLAAIKPFMCATDVWRFHDKGFHELSGGEKQRVIISQALAQEAKLLLLDEPTSDLDIQHQVEVFRVLDSLRQKTGITILAVLHDLNLASLYCERIIALKAGQVVADGTPQEVFTTSNVQSIYGINVDILNRPSLQPVIALRKD